MAQISGTDPDIHNKNKLNQRLLRSAKKNLLNIGLLTTTFLLLISTQPKSTARPT